MTKPHTRRRLLQGLGAGSLMLGAGPLLAQGRPMTVLVGAASSMDFTARLLADELRQAFDRPVIAVSKLGAGGRVALAELKRAAPDGETIMLSTSSAFVVYPNIYERLDYDPGKDFTPIINVAWFDVAIAVGPDMPVNSLAELSQWIKKQPGEVVYGCAPGTGSSSHFAGIAFEVATGTKLKPIPYKDSGQGIADTIGGRIPIMITGTTPLAAQHNAGKIKLLATSGPRRSPMVSGVPTMKESGVDVEITINCSLYGPAGLDSATVARIHDAAHAILTRDAIREKLTKQGMSVDPFDGRRLADVLHSERDRYAQLAKAAGMTKIQ
ncbi:MAG: tripartite tricarboxylate transporter substrate binding protein [Burkholderiaceae bacterium]